MAKGSFMTIIAIGLALIFIPIVIVGIAFMGGANWETVGQEVAIPILIIYILGIVFIFLADYW